MSRYWLIAIALVLLLGFLSRRGERADSKPKQIRPGGNSPTTADIDALLRAGQKIEAIKLYRQQHGVDLKAAKDVIDARGRELGT